jgi:hypothetical protein
MKRKVLLASAGLLAVVILLSVGACIWVYSHGYYHALRGGIAQSRKDVDEAIAFLNVAYEKNSDAFMVAHDLACCYALKGDRESSIHWLRLALKTSYAGYAKEYAKTEPDFDSVRQTPEFQALIYDSTK